ncbi:MAG: hypothetical protein QOI11_124 [Candidatus Eremiobacteraeota bacterium]|jgi:hypothetical protein|nr:hypothetical protein [Candidatus Eremiobacteraeota bacterium]
MEGFGELLGGLAEGLGLFGEAREKMREGTSPSAAEGGEAGFVDSTRYLVGGPRELNINDI